MPLQPTCYHPAIASALLVFALLYRRRPHVIDALRGLSLVPGTTWL
jgi:hypothetical protein